MSTEASCSSVQVKQVLYQYVLFVGHLVVLVLVLVLVLVPAVGRYFEMLNKTTCGLCQLYILVL